MMNIIKTSSLATGLTALLGLTSYAVAAKELPATCFSTPEDQQQYVSKIASSDPSIRNEAQKLLKPITIKVQQTQPASGERITLDASASSVPSGDIGYQWGGTVTSTTSSPTYSLSGGSPGSYSNITLYVSDKVCGTTAHQRLTVTSK